MDTVPFKVFKVSSFDPAYEASELETSDPNSKGWQSQRFCNFPQQLILQFKSNVKLKALQFLCHQSKIPSAVELVAVQSNGMSSHSLGAFELKDNRATQFWARELKTVYLEAETRYLKIVMFKNHKNPLNIFNQVGFLQIKCFGEELGYTQPAIGIGAYNPQGPPVGISTHTRQLSSAGSYFGGGLSSSRQFWALESMFEDKLMALERRAKQAIVDKNIEEAKEIKSQRTSIEEMIALSRTLEQ